MIRLHRLNNVEFVLNADQIKFIESTPDTLISLTGENGKVMVRETIAEVLQKVAEYKRICQAWPLGNTAAELVGAQGRDR